MQMRQQAVKYHCGECGDTGFLPEETWVRYGNYAYEPSKVPCTSCECCEECGIELREHSRLTGECP